MSEWQAKGEDCGRQERGDGCGEAAAVLVVMCTFPEVGLAREVAGELVAARLAACVNLVPVVESVYRWQGVVESATEVMAVVKTTRDRYPELEKFLLARHPYEVPEVLALPVVAGSAAYLAWVAAEAGGQVGA